MYQRKPNLWPRLKKSIDWRWKPAEDIIRPTVVLTIKWPSSFRTETAKSICTFSCSTCIRFSSGSNWTMAFSSWNNQVRIKFKYRNSVDGDFIVILRCRWYAVQQSHVDEYRSGRGFASGRFSVFCVPRCRPTSRRRSQYLLVSGTAASHVCGHWRLQIQVTHVPIFRTAGLAESSE